MKTLETSSNALLQWFGNATAVDMDRITSRAVVNGPWSGSFVINEPAVIFNQAANEGGRAYKVIGALMSSLFWNGVSFKRVVFIDGKARGWFYMRRLSSTRLFQCGIGWKLNGRLAVLFRFQTDASAAAGVSGPNLGQATGYDWGPH